MKKESRKRDFSGNRQLVFFEKSFFVKKRSHVSSLLSDTVVYIKDTTAETAVQLSARTDKD